MPSWTNESSHGYDSASSVYLILPHHFHHLGNQHIILHPLPPLPPPPNAQNMHTSPFHTHQLTSASLTSLYFPKS
jgi:hypothetical protein